VSTNSTIAAAVWLLGKACAKVLIFAEMSKCFTLFNFIAD
jgi:hypothetical protein